jgi:hypothetical protein
VRDGGADAELRCSLASLLLIALVCIVAGWDHAPLLDPGYASIIVAGWDHAPLLDPGYASIIVAGWDHARTSCPLSSRWPSVPIP